MPEHAFALDKFTLELCDFSRPLSPFRAKLIISECEKAREALKAHPRQLAHCDNMIGVALCRTGKTSEAAARFRNAVHLMPQETVYRGNLGLALTQLDRLHEALDELLRAVEEAPRDLLTHCNLVWCLIKLGMQDDAVDVFQEVLRLTDHRDPRSVIHAARAAADVGLEHEAIELFARYVALSQGIPLTGDPVEVIENAPESVRGALDDVGAEPLRSCVARARALRDVQPEIREIAAGLPSPRSSEASNEGALTVFESTKPARVRATTVAMAKDADA